MDKIPDKAKVGLKLCEELEKALAECDGERALTTHARLRDLCEEIDALHGDGPALTLCSKEIGICLSQGNLERVDCGCVSSKCYF